MKPRVLLLRTAGTNCDLETVHAFELAGAEARRVHVNRLLESQRDFEEAQILAIPGGFSFGDDISAGRILAQQLTARLGDTLRAFIAAGKPIIGICNGFQVLVKTDLLPGPLAGKTGMTATLTNNISRRFEDRWVHVKPVSRKCIWTRDLVSQYGEASLTLPIAHGEGNFVCADASVRSALHAADQVALVYAAPSGLATHTQNVYNPNGSMDDIAGVCDSTGLILGLMPHPERHVTFTQHPTWTRLPTRPRDGDGLAIFRNAVKHVDQTLGAGV